MSQPKKQEKPPQQPFKKIIEQLLDAAYTDSESPLTSCEWLQIHRTDRECANNVRIRLPLYLDLWKKMKQLQKTAYLSDEYFRASALALAACGNNQRMTVCSFPDEGLKPNSRCITRQQSPFDRYIVAIRREPVIRFDLSNLLAGETPRVYEKRIDPNDGKARYHYVGLVVEAPKDTDFAIVKTRTNQHELLYSCKELYCLRDNISDPKKEVPDTVPSGDVENTSRVDYYFQRRCTTCCRGLIVKHPAEDFNKLTSMCEQVTNVMESIDLEEQEHQKTCSDMFAELRRSIYS